MLGYERNILYKMTQSIHKGKGCPHQRICLVIINSGILETKYIHLNGRTHLHVKIKWN
jgi:hypothetical protein